MPHMGKTNKDKLFQLMLSSKMPSYVRSLTHKPSQLSGSAMTVQVEASTHIHSVTDAKQMQSLCLSAGATSMMQTRLQKAASSNVRTFGMSWLFCINLTVTSC